MSEIPDVAIDAGADALRESWPADFSARLLARAVIEAAMPAIREAIAQEIEAVQVVDGAGKRNKGIEALVHSAAAHVRGGVQ